jgi:hypothetical protein
MNGFLERWATGATGGPESSKSPAPAIPGSDDAVVPDAAPEIVPDDGQPALPLKGHAVELWRDGSRFFLVADEEDAQEAIKRFGTHRGEIWIPTEIELVGRIEDQITRDEIADFKRQIGGRLSPCGAGEAVPVAEQKASMLNELFRKQGVLAQPGKITAATVRDGERKAREKEL